MNIREAFEKCVALNNNVLLPNGIDTFSKDPNSDAFLGVRTFGSEVLLGTSDTFFGIVPSPNYLFCSYLSSLKKTLENHFSHQKSFLEYSNLLIADSLVQLELMNFVYSFYHYLKLKFTYEFETLDVSLFSDWSYVTTVVDEYIPIFCENYRVESEHFCAAYDKHNLESYLHLISQSFSFDTFYYVPLRPDE